MGRGRAKAKQVKVARQLKYNSGNTDLDRLKELLKSPLIFDGRNIYDPGMLGRFGFTYYAIGRGRTLPPE